MIKINHQINEEGINNPVFFRNSNLFKLSFVDSGAINLSIARPLKLCPQRQKKKPKPKLEPPSLSPIDQFSLQQTSPLGFASISRQLNARRPNEAQAKRIPRSTL